MGMREAEEYTGVGEGDKASMFNYLYVLAVGNAAKYGNIAIFGGVVDTGMREAEEHTGVRARDKASTVRC